MLPPPDVASPDDDVAPWSPAPGRPAGAWPRLAERIDEILDATGAGWRTVLGAVLVAGVLGGAAWWALRDPPVPVEATLPVLDASLVSTTTAPPPDVVVHVAGAVVAPGVQRLPAGARVVDAVEAAGGLRPDADPSRVNLAATVVDGSQIYVPAVGEAVPATASGGADDGGGPIDLNTATAAELEELPGVGPSTAAAIIDHRERNGPFTSVDDLLDVRGIGEAKLAALRDLVRV